MTEYVVYNTNDFNVSSSEVEEIRRQVYESNLGEEAEVAICVWMWTVERMDKVRLCIDSILKYTEGIKFKLILLNNGGGDEVQNFYESILHEDKMIINVTKNLGSPHGASVIMRYVKNKYCVQVLNDCVVTKNWLSNMLLCMKSDPKIGMVCPLSTNVSNMQAVNLEQCKTIDEIQDYTEKYNQSNSDLWEERMRLMPICALYRREVFDMVGIYDPGFRHEFSDDDISIRIRRGGYRLMLCGDTIVHHEHIYDLSRPDDSERVQKGRKGFYEKYNQIDAWDDFQNFIIPYLSQIAIDKNDKCYKVLGIDCRCGTPILDIKNWAEKNKVKQIECHALTTDQKYVTDLETITNYTQYLNNIELIRNYFEDKYDFIYFDRVLNGYADSFFLINYALEHLVVGGYLIIKIKNVFDVETFLACLGYADCRENREITIVKNEDVVSYLLDRKQSNIKVFTKNKMISTEISQQIYTEISNMKILNNEVDEVFQRLCVDEYVYIIKYEEN